MILAGGAGAAYLAYAPRIYISETVVQVEAGAPKVMKIEDVNPEALATLESLTTIEKNLAGRALVERLLADKTLDLTPSKLGLPPRPEKPYSDNELVECLKNRVSASIVRGTRLVSVTVENESAALAQKIARALVEAYRSWTFEGRGDVANEANRFLVEEAERLKKKLRQSEQLLQDYKEKSNTVSLDGKQDIITDSLKDLSSKLTQARGDRLTLESAHLQLKEFNSREPEALLGVAAINSDAGVLEQKKRLGERELELVRLKQWLLPKHPRYVQAERSVDEVRATLNRAILNARESIDARYDAAVQTEKKLEAALKEQEQKSLELNHAAIDYNMLNREVEADRALLDSVLTRTNETDLTRTWRNDAIRLVQGATLPDRPSKPRKKIVLGGALMAGLLLGVMLTFARHVLDHSLRTVDAAEHWLGLPALGTLPLGGRCAPGRRLFLIHQPESPMAEAFRTLRTSLTLAATPSDSQTMLFTSALEGEGKSFCASNCAVAFAQLGLPTLLVDADLRVPSIGKIFAENNGTPAGVADVISGKIKLAEAARPTGIPNLSLLTAGHHSGNPAELLAGRGFADLIREASRTYRRVIVDSAPVNPVSDTLLLVKHVNTVCLVVDSRKTPREGVIRAIHLLHDAGARMAGIVLNRLPVQSGRSCYYHYSGGSYGNQAYAGSPAVEAVSSGVSTKALPDKPA
ncbi:MAG: polysaccharide biosynthesis transport protein [Chthoniobacter sp.]|nr:polysaccharide biosynthesis transport protein [Chthoniobacter sp.]